MNNTISYSALLLTFISFFASSFCSARQSVVHKKEYVPISKMDYIVDGRYETNSEYIGFSGSGVTVSILQLEEIFSIWIEDLPADPTNNNWLNILVGGKKNSSIPLKTGKHLYIITSPVNNHQLVQFVKATEANVGEVRIYGLEFSKRVFQHDSIETSIKNIPRIQFIGNSITCGYGNMVSIQPPPVGNPLTGFHSMNENAYDSYAMQTARRLKMNPVLVAFSGKGMYRNFDGDTLETLPNIYDRIHLQNKNSPVWDHTQQVPEIIVINLGTNDYFGESRNEPLDDRVFVQTYMRFVEKLMKLYPKAKIICANGSMLNNGWPEGKKCWSRIQANLKSVQQHFQAKGNTNIYTFFFTPQTAPYGEDYHPSLATHTKMAEELTTFIQTVVNK